MPPLYTIVGLYRLITDPLIRGPVLDKVKHAAARGFIVGAVYAVGSWKVLDWFVRKFLVGGRGGGFFGLGGGKKVDEALGHAVEGKIHVGFGAFSVPIDLVFCQSGEIPFHRIKLR